MYRPASPSDLAATSAGGLLKGPSIRNKRYRRGGTQAAKEKVYEQQLLAARLKVVERYVLDKMRGGVRPASEMLVVDGDEGGGEKKV